LFLHNFSDGYLRFFTPIPPHPGESTGRSVLCVADRPVEALFTEIILA